jgi:DNA-binding transcriptional ArsR family regulator
MVSTNQIAEIGLLVGEPARAAILVALMDGQALTATELARCAGVTPQTASSHLSRLAAANLLKVEKQGRHRYHRLANADIAGMLEGIMQIASTNAAEPRKIVVGPRDEALRRARTCYDHFAGRLGVSITEALETIGAIEFGDDAGVITHKGLKLMGRLGIELEPSEARSKRPLCRPCLDWSERRPHVAGRLGKAICTYFLDRKFVRRVKDTRALHVTPQGHAALRDMFGIRGF